MADVPVNHFDRGKPFYPLIMNYLFLIRGFLLLVAEGVKRTKAVQERRPAEASEEDWYRNLPDDLARHLRLLEGPLKLRSDFQGNFIEMDVEQLAYETLFNGRYLVSFQMRSAGGLLILAWETTEPYHDQGPLWEFLRHCRHAAAHNGRFRFTGQPRRPAQWGPMVLDRGLHGMPLFKGREGNGLLSVGDPIRLLWDIEQEYPDMKVS